MGKLIDTDNIKYVFDLTKTEPTYSGKDIETAIRSMKAADLSDRVVTNGDMMSAVFPKALIYVDTALKIVWFCIYDDKDDEDFDKHITFPLEWWNAPYKKGE